MTLLVKAGKYTGDGSDPQTISGVGFQPKAVFIMATTGTGSASCTQWKTADMSTGATGVTRSLGDAVELATGQIDSFTSDGFLVRDQKNISTRAYYYLALGGSSCVTGTYTGDGIDNKAITGIGFKPKWVVVGGGAATSTLHKCTATGDSTDNSQYFLGAVDTANRIQSLDSDGFTVGNATNINVAATTYYYMAITGDNVFSGSYTGDLVDNTLKTGIPFIPESILIKGSGATQSFWRTKESGDLTSRMTANQGPTSNGIQAYLFRGFNLGSGTSVNNTAVTYYYIAFGKTGGDGGFF